MFGVARSTQSSTCTVRALYSLLACHNRPSGRWSFSTCNGNGSSNCSDSSSNSTCSSTDRSSSSGNGSSHAGSNAHNSSKGANNSTGSLVGRELETPLLHTIRNHIMVRGGPLSVAEYMQEALTNPSNGYYMKCDVFGRRGDFVTSPEISQMFGEMVGIWCVLMWQSLGCPSQLRLVELGPGRGTLMADLLRGTAGFRQFAQALQVHLVEVSPFMRKQQWKALNCSAGSNANAGPSISSETQSAAERKLPEFDQGICAINGAQVFWHSSLYALSAGPGPTLYLAHEFLDALPVHQFVRDERRGWLEVMIDTADDEGTQGIDSRSGLSSAGQQLSQGGVPLVMQKPWQQQQQQQGPVELPQHNQQQQQDLHLRFVLSPTPTPASQLLVPRRLARLAQGGQQQQQGSEHQQQHSAITNALEIGAHAMAVCETLACRISAHGGAALLIDYGQNCPYQNSLTAIRGHEGVHPLSQPGTADISAWVDFSAMRMAAEEALEVQQASQVADSRSAAASGTASAVGAAAAGYGVDVYGPVDQADLLHRLGIQARLQALAQAASPQQIEALVQGYHRLVDKGAGGMGASYKALAIVNKGVKAPIGFGVQEQ